MIRYRGFIADNRRFDGFVFRAGDTLVCTPAKSGTTWMQTIVGMLILDTDDLGVALTEVSPWLEMLISPLEDVVARLDAQEHRRFVKTHTPLDGLPWHDDVTYLHVVRHPLDAALSWVDHEDNADIGRVLTMRSEAVGLDDLDRPPEEDPDDTRSAVRKWIDREPLPQPSATGMASLHEYVHHATTYWAARHRPNVHLFHYRDLVRDLPGQMRRVAGTLGIEPGARFEDQVAAASFASMRARAEQLAPDAQRGTWKSATDFFRSGGSRRWQDDVSPDDVAAFEDRLTALSDPDVARWLCRGTDTGATT